MEPAALACRRILTSSWCWAASPARAWPRKPVSSPTSPLPAFRHLVTVRQIMRFDHCQRNWHACELEDNRAFSTLFPCSSEGVCSCGALHEIPSKVVKICGIY
jgi:hypothetical protein